MSHARRISGFTLIELLVVIAIIAMLMAILLPALNRAKKQGQAVRCLSNLKQIGVAAYLYAQDYNMMIPRDEMHGHWMVLFTPYVGGKSNKVLEWTEVDIYNCPSYPEKEQIVDYCNNAWDPKEDKELRRATRLDDFKRPGQTIYVSDYEYIATAPHIQVVYRNDDRTQLHLKLRWMDVYAKDHLPSGGDTTRRVARERHGRFTNCLYADGHSDKVNSTDMTPWDWGLPRSEQDNPGL